MFKIEFVPWLKTAHLECLEMQPYIEAAYCNMQRNHKACLMATMGLTPSQIGREQPSTTTLVRIQDDIRKTLLIKKTANVGPSTLPTAYVWPRETILANQIKHIINYRGA